MDILLASLKELGEAYAWERVYGTNERAEMFHKARQERLEAIVVASRNNGRAKKADRRDTEGQ